MGVILFLFFDSAVLSVTGVIFLFFDYTAFFVTGVIFLFFGFFGNIVFTVTGVIIFIIVARDKRATRGAYSPSRQETAGARVELGNVLKKPPEERLI